MNLQNLYKLILVTLFKLKGWDFTVTVIQEKEDEIQTILSYYILREVSEKEILKIFKDHPTNLRQSLIFPPVMENEKVFEQSKKFYEAMKKEKNWEDFKEKNDKEFPKRLDITDFDKLLKAFMKVKKPDEKKISK